MRKRTKRRLGIFCMFCGIPVLFAASAGIAGGDIAYSNLIYIGEAIGPNARLTYFLKGPAQGEAVVLLPGMGRGADDFREFAAALNNAGYRTVAIQPRGIGRSGPVLTAPTYDQFADDVALVLKDIPGGIVGGKAHVLGYEFGNRVARMFAVKYPERVQSLILLACGGQQVSSSRTNASETAQSGSDVPEPVSDASPSASPSAPEALAADSSAITKTIDAFFADLVANTAETDPHDVTLSGMTAAFAYWLTPSEREPFVKHAFFAPMSQVPYYWVTGWYRDTGWMQEAMDVDHSSTSADWVSGGRAPMLILQGEYDVAAPVENGTYMKKTYPDRVTMAVVPDAGHAMLAEQNAFIVKHVISYLERYSVKGERSEKQMH